MNVTVLLADKGTPNLLEGTLNLLNAAWFQTQLRLTPQGPMTGPMALAVFYEVDIHKCNQALPMVIELRNQDSLEAVPLPGPAGHQPMRVEQSVTVPLPTVAPHGTPGRGNSLLELTGGLPLPPGSYRWQVSLDGRQEDEWSASFHIAPLPTMPTFGAPHPPSG